MKHQKTLLRKLRRDREISLDAVSAATGINVSTLSRAERGLIDLTDDNKNRLARYFRVPASALLKDGREAVA